MRRGEIWWAALPEPAGSGPGFRRPVLIVQSDDFNKSRIRTIVAVVITSNLKLAAAPGNVLLRGRACGLKRDSVANVSQVVTLDRDFLTARAGKLSAGLLQDVESGLRLVLSLS